MAAKDITTIGSKFNRLTVTSAPFIRTGKCGWYVQVRCDVCGHVKSARCDKLANGQVQSCMCAKVPTPAQTIAVIGAKFHRLTVISEPWNDGKWRYRVKCRCDCGNESTVAYNDLTRGKVKSCGCMTLEGVTTHGLSKSATYKIWDGMKQRCTNPKFNGFENYGGRGITVCYRWLNSFENFLSDMGPRPIGMSIERKDNSLGYSPENCVWATPKEQLNNTRANHFIEYDGRTLTLMQWSEKTGIPYRALQKRIKYGWPTDRLLTEPARKLKRHGEIS